MRYKSQYLIFIEYLGFRYSGWQKQPGRKTVESMLTKTLGFVLPGRTFKILAAGRTDARVSALQAAFELFLTGDPIEDISGFLEQFNTNLPADIRALDIQEVPQSFNIIKHCKEKEYRYFFACGQKIHPFCAPLMAGIPETLEMDLMMEAAPYFEGSHDFRAYTAKNENERDFIRTIRYCRLGKNTLLTANFFPPDSYMLVVRGSGFMRYQVRMMMGALLELGRGNLNLQDLKSSLEAGNSSRLSYVAPGSGLLLHSVKFG